MDVMCPTCGQDANYIETYSRWYCYSCKQYLEEHEDDPGIESSTQFYYPDREEQPSTTSYEYPDREEEPYVSPPVTGPAYVPPAKEEPPVVPKAPLSEEPAPAQRPYGRPMGQTAEQRRPPAYGGPPPTQAQYRGMGDFRLPDISHYAQRTGKVLLILSIIGLVLFLALPWISIMPDEGDDIHYNYDGEAIAGNTSAEKLKGSFWNTYEDRIWMSLLGSTGGIIIGGLLLYSDRMMDLRKERGAIALVGGSSAIVVLLAALILFSGATFIGWTLTTEMNQATDDDLKTDLFSPAGAVAMVVGGVMVVQGLRGFKTAITHSREFEMRFKDQHGRHPDIPDQPTDHQVPIHDPYYRQGGF